MEIESARVEEEEGAEDADAMQVWLCTLAKDVILSLNLLY